MCLEMMLPGAATHCFPPTVIEPDVPKLREHSEHSERARDAKCVGRALSNHRQQARNSLPGASDLQLDASAGDASGRRDARDVWRRVRELEVRIRLLTRHRHNHRQILALPARQQADCKENSSERSSIGKRIV